MHATDCHELTSAVRRITRRAVSAPRWLYRMVMPPPDLPARRRSCCPSPSAPAAPPSGAVLALPPGPGRAAAAAARSVGRSTRAACTASMPMLTSGTGAAASTPTCITAAHAFHASITRAPRAPEGAPSTAAAAASGPVSSVSRPNHEMGSESASSSRTAAAGSQLRMSIPSRLVKTAPRRHSGDASFA